VALGVADVAVAAGSAVVALAFRVAGPMARALPGWDRLAGALAERGAVRRDALVVVAAGLLDRVVPLVVTEVLRRVDLTDLVRTGVDLDELVAGVDLDAAAARLDLDAVLARLDLDAVVGRVDLDSLVARVDVAAVVDRVDLDAAAARLDLDAVIGRLDLTGIAAGVIEDLDLPELIRESTGSMASDTVRGARMQGIAADEAVARAMERLRVGGRRRRSSPLGSTP
jgi:hypothetical protein